MCGETHISRDMCAGTRISRGHTYHCDTGTDLQSKCNEKRVDLSQHAVRILTDNC